MERNKMFFITTQTSWNDRSSTSYIAIAVNKYVIHAYSTTIYSHKASTVDYIVILQLHGWNV